jgi:hypothetical protein
MFTKEEEGQNFRYDKRKCFCACIQNGSYYYNPPLPFTRNWPLRLYKLQSHYSLSVFLTSRTVAVGVLRFSYFSSLHSFLLLLSLINFTIKSPSTISLEIVFSSFSFFHFFFFYNLQYALHSLPLLFFYKAKRKTSAASRRKVEVRVVLCVVYLIGRRQEKLHFPPPCPQQANCAVRAA